MKEQAVTFDDDGFPVPTQRERAEHWLAQADGRIPEAGMECIATAQVHAILAVAEALETLALALPEAARSSDDKARRSTR